MLSTREPTRRAFSRLRETAHMICQPHRRASPLPNSENLDLLTRLPCLLRFRSTHRVLAIKSHFPTLPHPISQSIRRPL